MPGPARPIRTWIDPHGRTIRLYAADWYNHVLWFHPPMRRHLAWVQAAVEQPELIYRDADRADRECYYRGGLLRRRPGLLVKVVVDYSAGEAGRVVTAYPTDKPKGGETRLWP